MTRTKCPNILKVYTANLPEFGEIILIHLSNTTGSLEKTELPIHNILRFLFHFVEIWITRITGNELFWAISVHKSFQILSGKFLKQLLYRKAVSHVTLVLNYLTVIFHRFPLQLFIYTPLFQSNFFQNTSQSMFSFLSKLFPLRAFTKTFPFTFLG